MASGVPEVRMQRSRMSWRRCRNCMLPVWRWAKKLNSLQHVCGGPRGRHRRAGYDHAAHGVASENPRFASWEHLGLAVCRRIGRVAHQKCYVIFPFGLGFPNGVRDLPAILLSRIMWPRPPAKSVHSLNLRICRCGKCRLPCRCLRHLPLNPVKFLSRIRSTTPATASEPQAAEAPPVTMSYA